jgi:hypothetical protein
MIVAISTQVTIDMRIMEKSETVILKTPKICILASTIAVEKEDHTI